MLSPMTLFCAAALLCSTTAIATEATQNRRHIAALDATGRARFTMTEIESMDSSNDQQVILLRDEGTAETWILSNRISYADHESAYEIHDVTGDRFLRLTSPLEFGGSTREEFIAEYRSNRPLMEVEDPLLTIETPGNSRTARESEWNEDANARRWRSDLRRGMNPALLDAMERMRGLFDRLPMSLFNKMLFRRVLYPGGADKHLAIANIVVLNPDCAFDALFNHDCTDEQKRRIEAATEAGERLARY
jgi:hypothetical protein